MLRFLLGVAVGVVITKIGFDKVVDLILNFLDLIKFQIEK